MANFTEADKDRVLKILRSGAQTVDSPSIGRVSHRSQGDLVGLLRLIESDLAGQAGTSRRVRIVRVTGEKGF